MEKIVFITGASSGIGFHTARRFAASGANLVLGARRLPLIEDHAEALQKKFPIKAKAFPLDVQDEESCRLFIKDGLKSLGHIDVLVNNAGLALGMDAVVDQRKEDARIMMETNVLGLLSVTREALPSMIKRGQGHIINIGSIAGYMAYEKASVYCATKYAVRAISQSLRIELVDKNIRVSNIAPGMTETEFSLTRFRGDKDKSDKVYKDLKPLTGEDIAEIIVFTSNLPSHINIDELVVRPTQQAPGKVYRKPTYQATQPQRPT